MTSLPTSTPAVRELRWLKPIIALAVLIVLLRYLMPAVSPSNSLIWVLGGLVGTADSRLVAVFQPRPGPNGSASLP